MLFTPSQAYMPNRHRQRSALRTFFPSSSFSPPDPKEPLRRGILFSSVATVLLLIGTILTWLGFNDVFGGKISMTGPLLIALALLMLLLSLRQFMLARRRNRTRSEPVQMETVNTGGVTAVIDHDDGNGAATIVIETWDSDEPNQDSISCRNNNDLAPPSYMDIAQSCSSNCPSFMSHEDHNEAPPTYEETCGLYSSDISLNQMGRHHSSSQFESSPSPQMNNHSGHQFFAHELTCNHNYEMCPASEPGGELVQTLCPAASANQCLNHEPARTTCYEHNATQPGLCADPRVTNNPAGHSLHFLASKPGGDLNPTSCAPNRTPSEWSRRSFSSIPSYTCLLSESGEVSSHVFDTSSIIEEMMPLLAVQGKAKEPECGDTIIPTRSHSMSSVNAFRQGVPYITGVQTGTGSPRTSAVPSPLLHGQQMNSGDILHGSTYHHNISDTSSKKPPTECQLVQGHNPNVADVLTVQSPQVCDHVLLHSQPGQTNSSASSSPSSWNVSNCEEVSEHGKLLPLLEVQLDVHSRQRPANITTTFQDSSYAPVTFHDSNSASVTLHDSNNTSATFRDSNTTSATLRDSNNTTVPFCDSNIATATFRDSNSASTRSMISNTQDVQETI